MPKDHVIVTVAYSNKERRPHPADPFHITVDNSSELIFLRREIPLLISKLLVALFTGSVQQ